jgi:hypothetical protein
MPQGTTETTSFLSKTRNWKSTGNDQVTDYWLTKVIPSYADLHHRFLQHTNRRPKQMPEWLTTGITYLLPKSEDTEEPKNYRPITSLSTMYNTLTGIIAKRISLHLEGHSLLPAE